MFCKAQPKPPAKGDRVKLPETLPKQSRQHACRDPLDCCQTTQRLYLVTTQYLNMIASGGWVASHYVHNHTTSWLHLASSDIMSWKNFGPKSYCHTGPNLGISAVLEILQVGPRSGMILQQEPPNHHPPTHPPP